MVDGHTGNVQPAIDLEEHHGQSNSKRTRLMQPRQSDGTAIAVTAFEYNNSNPLAVVLVDTNGDAYVASGGGGGGGNVTAHIAASVTLYAVVNTSGGGGGGNVTAYIAGQPISVDAVGTVTVHQASSVTIYAVVDTEPAITGTVTAIVADAYRGTTAMYTAVGIGTTPVEVLGSRPSRMSYSINVPSNQATAVYRGFSNGVNANTGREIMPRQTLDGCMPGIFEDSVWLVSASGTVTVRLSETWVP